MNGDVLSESRESVKPSLLPSRLSVLLFSDQDFTLDNIPPFFQYSFMNTGDTAAGWRGVRHVPQAPARQSSITSRVDSPLW